jgi:benzoyl-CoA reductase/2-hydroxyglutaryl-CoA dehydratase subunit BcrC/BadD/HgdB
MTKILYTSPYVPAEWIAAHGLEPVRVTPARVDRPPAALDRQGVCPFVRSFVASVLTWPRPAALAMTTTCDQMRRAFDVVARASKLPAFLMNVPSTWQSIAARRLYVGELDRLSGFLVRTGGTRPSDGQLAEVMLAHDDTCVSPNGTSASTRGLRIHPTIPVALVGGPLCREDYAIFEMVEACGGCVLLDATESGVCGLRRAFDHRRLREEPLLELADAYFDGIRDVSRRPNDGFYNWLRRELARNDIRAVIVHRHLWCDLWHAEVERLREKTGLPVLDLDASDGEAADSNRNRTRIGAFLEMLK